VRDQLKGMVISSSSSSTSRKSKPVKEGDAKRQVQKMIKKCVFARSQRLDVADSALLDSLITSTQALDELPRRRFVTIRLFYTPETPEDYEPPLFR
jgi:meiosis-specific protein HOP1